MCFFVCSVRDVMSFVCLGPNLRKVVLLHVGVCTVSIWMWHSLAHLVFPNGFNFQAINLGNLPVSLIM